MNSRQIESRPERTPILRKAVAAIVVVAVGVLVVSAIVHFILGILWVVIGVVAVAAVLWALNTLL